jgi:hypothetical protein
VSIGVDSSVGRALHIAVELNHAPSGLHWVDLTESGFGSVAVHSTVLPGSVTRIRAPDLGTAQREYRSLRSVAVAAGRDPDSIRILVDVAAMIDVDARSARKRLMKIDSARCETRQRGSIEYVGTPRGLAGLVSDISAAGVADGVTIQPLHACVFRGLVEQTIPILVRSGVFSLSDRAYAAAVGLALRSHELHT